MFDWAIARREAFDPSGIGTAEVVDTGMRNSLSHARDPEAPWVPMLRSRIGALLPEMVDALGLEPFDWHAIELEMLAYNDGAFYRRHTDIAHGGARRKTDRMISAVYYFHPEPRAFEGGMLRLYPLMPGPGARHAEIEAEGNSLAIFPSWAPHEVMPVACPTRRFADSRFAVNCWVRRARTPGDQSPGDQ